MAAYQKIIVVGNVGRDPEMRFTPDGQAVTAFSVAVNEKYKPANGNEVKWTDWYRIETWGKLAEVCNQYLKKGSSVLVEGTLKSDHETGGPRIWTDKDGKARASFEVKAGTVRFLSSVEKHEPEQPEF